MMLRSMTALACGLALATTAAAQSKGEPHMKAASQPLSATHTMPQTPKPNETQPVQPPGKEGLTSGIESSYFHSKNRIRIPRGRLPPEGLCGIWYPDRKPEEQPKPFKCVPTVKVERGGFLMAPGQDPISLDVTVYDEKQPDTVVARGTFDTRTGTILRVTEPRKPSDINPGAPGAKPQ